MALGGRVSFDLTPNIQAIGELGRLSVTADSIASVLNAGNACQVNEARFGLGVRF